MCRRLGWPSLAGKRLLDYGCGVRFTRTLINLGMDIGFYAGVDVNKEAITWLQANVTDKRFRFEPLGVKNQMYNPDSRLVADKNLLTGMGFRDFDAACMFSVITHQDPDEAALTFAMLRESVHAGGRLYFTALVDEKTERYKERDPEKPGLLSVYNPDLVVQLVEQSGWRVEATYPPSTFQQAAYICR
jgi:SAM-dependent methyltransferase